MNFGLLVSHLPRQLPEPLPPSDAGHVRSAATPAPSAPMHGGRSLADRWRRLKARVFAV
ncbi:hypothetical protein [Paraburkholderia caballeronis]|uniref:Uncharacterized protein n=1 Tax=Paraburkholderia caballeronis TaxID=416943 RepID=A0A1H7VU02_9BURK|nr:hypothetical protein [Paraburkholderia caballeronis]PXW15439.1 hypothetical protein C7403_1252 [Paraburkholderia caballeronis]PXW93724.1 hypothetical protein C7407_1252 [Paraburkholderia caballeronis]RAJ88964.1 hypothetical protein C7409_1252 [Paraburkholderia caballeronis]SED97109.1 hypothetical protein SAMN05445871_4371 [Paraburkholderia caballeronis]SEM12706.1 hypothetical protein SAMN05192542_12771 [Paraburkholderia caballeronis]